VAQFLLIPATMLGGAWLTLALIPAALLLWHAYLWVREPDTWRRVSRAIREHPRAWNLLHFRLGRPVPPDEDDSLDRRVIAALAVSLWALLLVAVGLGGVASIVSA